jgi:hypothetical protein
LLKKCKEYQDVMKNCKMRKKDKKRQRKTIINMNKHIKDGQNQTYQQWG